MNIILISVLQIRFKEIKRIVLEIIFLKGQSTQFQVACHLKSAIFTTVPFKPVFEQKLGKYCFLFGNNVELFQFLFFFAA